MTQYRKFAFGHVIRLDLGVNSLQWSDLPTVDTSPTLIFKGSSTKEKKSFGVSCIRINKKITPMQFIFQWHKSVVALTSSFFLP